MLASLREKLREFDSDLPLGKASTIPSRWYFDEEIFEAEHREVFGNSWVCVGRTEEVAEAGTYFTAEIAKEPAIIARDKDNVLRAFSNVCRHRAARVAHKPCGKASSLQCRYHGWTYDLGGRLKGTPEFDGVQDFSKEKNGLPAFAVGTWGPWIFVHAGRVEHPLEEFLARFGQRTQSSQLDRVKFHARKEYTLDCNWKVFVDNYLDGGYHVNTIHPSLAGVINYAQYRTEIEGMASVQVSPLKTSVVSSKQSVVHDVRRGEAAYYWWVYPNLMVNIYEGVVDTNVVWPLSPSRCRVVFDFFFENLVGSQIEESLKVAHQVQCEDIAICEDAQRGLASSTYRSGRFSVKREAGGYHFHQLLARALQRAC